MHRHHIAGLVSGAGLLAAAGASAQTAPSTDFSHPYQQTGLVECGKGPCGLQLPKITAPQAVIQHVSCITTVKTGKPAPSAIVFSVPGDTKAGANVLPVFSLGSQFSGDSDGYAVNTDTQLFFSKGQQPTFQVVAAVGTLIAIDCTATGFHTTPMQAG